MYINMNVLKSVSDLEIYLLILRTIFNNNNIMFQQIEIWVCENLIYTENGICKLCKTFDIYTELFLISQHKKEWAILSRTGDLQ